MRKRERSCVRARLLRGRGFGAWTVQCAHSDVALDVGIERAIRCKIVATYAAVATRMAGQLQQLVRQQHGRSMHSDVSDAIKKHERRVRGAVSLRPPRGDDELGDAVEAT